MFQLENESAYDLRFSCLGIPVRVAPSFWIGALLSGGELLQGMQQFFVIWVLVLFSSILWHELGHALAVIAHGSRSRIVLYAFGGFATLEPPPRDWAVRVWVAFAGPFAGFLLAWGICAVLLLMGKPVQFEIGWPYLIDWQVSRQLPMNLGFFVLQMLHVNIWWGLINLLPVQPLDGGHICHELMMRYRPRDGRQIALQIGMVVAALASVYLYWATHSIFYAIFFAAIAYNQYLQLTGRFFH